MVGTAQPTGAVPAILEYNSDLAPSMFHGNTGVRDPRYMPRIGQGPQTAGGIANQDCGWYDTGVGGIALIDAVPVAINTTLIVNAQNPTANTPLPLRTGALPGMTIVPVGGFPMPVPVGATVPAGSIAIEGNSGYVGGGQSGAFAFFDPTKALSRCLQYVTTAGATAGTVTATGMDVYGVLIHETVTMNGSTPVIGNKAFKYVISVVPSYTDGTHPISVGTTDKYGMPMILSTFASAYSTVYYPAPTLITATTGYVAPFTGTSTATTGDVRGTYQLQAAANNANRLQVFAGMTVAQAVAASLAVYQTNIIGVAQF
jgi:hypothetical protein